MHLPGGGNFTHLHGIPNDQRSWHLIKDNEVKNEISYPFVQGDIQWTRKRTLTTCVISLFAGVLASLLGIGGGLVLGPLMLEMKVIPQVSTATSSLMIVTPSFGNAHSPVIHVDIGGDSIFYFAENYRRLCNLVHRSGFDCLVYRPDCVKLPREEIQVQNFTIF